METIKQLAGRSNSLFNRLLISFLVIILLLTGFSLYSISIVKNHLRGELIRYNTLNLTNTAQRYENHFRQIRTRSLEAMLSPKIQQLQTDMDFIAAREAMKELIAEFDKKDLMLDNLLIYYAKQDFVLATDRGAAAETMFTEYYENAEYSPAFWRSQFDKSYNYSAFPAADFREKGIKDWAYKGTFLPFIVRNPYRPNGLYVVALLNARSMSAQLQDSVNDNLFLYDQQGKLLYGAGSVKAPAASWNVESARYEEADDTFYFYRKGEYTGFTYVHVIPDTVMSRKLREINTLLVTLLVVCAAISIVASLFFTRSFHNPVKKLIRSITEMNAKDPFESNIREYRLMNERIHKLVQTSRDIREENDQQRSLLGYYAFLNKIKNIRIGGRDVQTFMSPGPYRLLLLRIRFTSRFYAELAEHEMKVVFAIRECVDTFLKERVESQTMQIETDALLSVVHTEVSAHKMTQMLKPLMDIFRTDAAYAGIVIGMGDRFEDADELTAAYGQVQRLIGNARMGGQPQLFGPDDPEPEQLTALTGLQEQELHANLLGGHKEGALRIVEKAVQLLQRKEALESAYVALAETVCQMTLKAWTSLQIDTVPLLERWKAHRGFRYCAEPDVFADDLTSFLNFALDGIRDKINTRDNIIDFVKQYTENHYLQDITLDILSDKLNISSSYLSTYFKSKTGMNFIDYVNQYRIGLAKTLLENPDVRIQDVASGVGYQNINSFNRMFKKICGVTPSEFRKQAAMQEEESRDGPA